MIPKPDFKRRHYLILNISETVQDRHIVTIEYFNINSLTLTEIFEVYCVTPTIRPRAQFSYLTRITQSCRHDEKEPFSVDGDCVGPVFQFSRSWFHAHGTEVENARSVIFRFVRSTTYRLNSFIKRLTLL